MSNLKVKICGLTNINDAIRAEDTGANYGGIVLSQGFGRSISLAIGEGIASSVGMRLVTVLVNEEIEAAEHLAASVKASVIQMH